jgi:two-component system, LuxR family, sensor kinase FixL
MQTTIDPHALLDAIAGPVLLLDARGTVQTFNRAAEQLFGYSAAEAIGSNINQFILINGADADSSPFWFSGRESQARKKDGAVLSVLATVEHMVNSEPPQFVCSIRPLDDVNQLHARMLHVSRLATMGEMAAGLAHELNQPLTAIANYAQAGKWLLESDPPDLAEINDTLGEITSQALRAGGIIVRLRGLIQRGEMQREQLPLDEVFNDVKGLIATECRLHSVKLHLNVDKQLPLVNADRVQIQQVLLILVRNAIEALASLPREQREIHISSRVRPEGYVELSVCDSGPGVAPEIRNRLFHPFSSTKPSNVGMGLATGKAIVEAHDGTLGYRQNLPHGACFYLSVPTAQGGES